MQDFEFTGDFLNEWNNRVYFRIHKISCEFKELTRTYHSCEKCGLNPTEYDGLYREKR